MQKASYKVEKHLAQVNIADSHLGIYFAPEKCKHATQAVIVDYTCALYLQMAVPQWMLTAFALLALLICCSGQFTQGGSSNCVAMVKLDQTWTSNVTGYYIAMLEIVGPQPLERLASDCGTTVAQ